MRRRDLKSIFLLAALAAMCCFGTAFANGSETPWKIRRPADNTVLPSEYVHRPGAGEALPGSEAQAPALRERPSVPETAPAAARNQPAAATNAPAPKASAKPSSPPATKQAEPPAAPKVDRGRAGRLEAMVQPAGVTLFLPLDRPAAEPRSFPLKQPARLVFDLAGGWDNVGANVYRVDSPLVEKVVMGEHEDFLRLVVYFTDAAGGKMPLAGISLTADGLRIEFDAK
ncbi:MAG: AMIN domain-containing protein [Desulfovibrio sp.]